MTMVSELVLTRNQLMEMARRQTESEFKVPLQRLSNVTAELQEGVMKTRMQPIGNAWQKLPRVVRDLAAELGKSIELEMHGAETELDRQVLDRIKDPLTHMVRNSADHGLETPADRLRRTSRKKARSACPLSRGRSHHHRDRRRRRGLEHRQNQEKAISRGLPAVPNRQDDRSADPRFIFAPGFSTRPGDQRSGRGVGMDVVLSQYRPDRRLGRREVDAGEGSIFTIKIR
jgi:two-component system chemotaxis sensor kinase CheA